MGCQTIYVVREPDGSLWWDGCKWGPLDFASAGELAGHLDTLERRSAPGDLVIDPSWCQGWFVDRDRQFGRFYPCNDDTCERFLQERRMRGAAGWRGWDLGIAWERSFEVAALSGLPMTADEHFQHLDGWAGCTEAGLLTRYVDPARFAYRWDPAAEELVYEWYDHRNGVDISTIDANGRVRDYGFEDRSMLFEALGHGPRLLDALRDGAPCPHLGTANAGAVVDEQERSIRYWIEPAVAPVTLAELRRRWPGFTIERERAGLAGHLQRTGRAADVHAWSGWSEPDLPYPPADPPRALSFLRTREVSAAELLPAPLPPDEARLLAAVHADPTSDTPRHAYADLLLAGGQRRGVLVQVQCELRPLVRAGERSARRRALEAEEAKLVRWYGHAIVPHADVRRFGRGFVEAVAVPDVMTLVAHDVLRDFPTIDDVEITEPVGAADIRDLHDAAGIARVRALSLRPLAGSLTELSGSALAGQLRRLTVHGHATKVTAELGAALATGRFEHLEELDLFGETFDASTAEALVAARLPALTHLTISSAPRFGDEGARLLATAALDSLTSLTLYSAGFGDAAAEELAWSEHLARLSSLDLAGNPLHGTGALALVRSTSLSGLRHLGLNNCPIDDSDVARLTKTPGFARFRSLHLWRCNITAAGVLALARSPREVHINELVLSRSGGPPEDYEPALAVLRERLGDALVLR